MKHNIFIGVDYQVGFCEGGNLPVKGGKKAVEACVRLLNHRVIKNEKTADELSYKTYDTVAHTEGYIKEVILTKDAHPVDHCSFKHFGGQWPWHCVEHTVDAAIMDPIIQTIASNGIPYGVVSKGQNKNEENYTAFRFVFKNQDMYTYSMAPNFEPSGNVLEFIQDPEDEENYNEIIIGGIAGDYCVLETIKVLIDLDPIIYLPGIASIDGGEALNKFIKEHNLRVMDEEFNISRA